MAWTNYRDIVGRFDHIDAEFVRSAGQLSADGGSAELVVRFYPWWEHPQYVSAGQRGDWGFLSFEAGKREVTVRAIRPWAFRLSPRQVVEEWGFEEEHPLLWDLATRSTVFANAPFDRGAFFDGLMGLFARTNVSEEDLKNYVQVPDSSKAPMGLTMPAQLHEPVLTVFSHMGVPVYSPSSPRTPPPAVVFLFGDDDYIIAHDFEVDVPEFIHEPEWFQPSR